MKFLGAGLAGVIAVSAGMGHAGGLERAPFRVAPLFEDGRYLELSAAYVLTSLSGDGGTIPPGFPGAGLVLSGNTGDLLEDYAQIGAAYKADVNDCLLYTSDAADD